MTEKRFKEIISTQKVIDTVTNKEYDCLLDNDLFDLINTIAEENEQLKDALNQRTEQCDKYYKENEQLKQQLQVCLKHHNCILETEKICVMCDECASLSMDYTNSIGGIL